MDTLKDTMPHAKSLLLESIRQQEGIIASYNDDLETEQESWRLKETQSLLDDAIEERDQLIERFKETFDVDYHTDLNQDVATYNFFKDTIEMLNTPEYKTASMYSDQDILELLSHYESKANAQREKLIKDYNFDIEITA